MSATLYHCTINRQEPGSRSIQPLRTRCLADLDSHWWQVEHPEQPGHWVGLPSWSVVLLGEVEPPKVLLNEAGEDETATCTFSPERGWHLIRDTEALTP